MADIVTERLDALKPWSANARTHSPKQICQVAASIETFGFTNPVLIDGARRILAGHGRVAAARHLGLSEVPCLRLEHMSEAQKRAYVIADNRLAENAGCANLEPHHHCIQFRLDRSEQRLSPFELLQGG